MAKLMFKILEDVKDSNNFYEVDQYELIPGNPDTLYFRFISSKSQDSEDQISDLRYIPASGSTVTVTFDHIDSNKKIVRAASLAFSADDRSIWKVSILATDTIALNSMNVVLTEGGVNKTILPKSRLKSTPTGSERFFA